MYEGITMRLPQIAIKLKKKYTKNTWTIKSVLCSTHLKTKKITCGHVHVVV